MQNIIRMNKTLELGWNESRDSLDLNKDTTINLDFDLSMHTKSLQACRTCISLNVQPVKKAVSTKYISPSSQENNHHHHQV